jgi:hypothetical protein
VEGATLDGFQASPLPLDGVDPLDPFVDLAFLFESHTSFKLRNWSVLEHQIDRQTHGMTRLGISNLRPRSLASSNVSRPACRLWTS